MRAWQDILHDVSVLGTNVPLENTPYRHDMPYEEHAH
jgi:hypothetical protein